MILKLKRLSYLSKQFFGLDSLIEFEILLLMFLLRKIGMYREMTIRCTKNKSKGKY